MNKDEGHLAVNRSLAPEELELTSTKVYFKFRQQLLFISQPTTLTKYKQTFFYF